MDDDGRWDARHRDAPDPMPRPPDGLAGLLDVLPQRTGRRALDVACGLGAVSLWAAGQGFAVDAVDRSAVAISRLRDRAVAAGLGGLVLARVADVAGALPADVTGPYDLVVCQRFRDPAVLRSLPGLLGAGGVLVVTVLSEVGAAAPSRFAAEAGELGRLARTAEGCEVLRDVEGAGEATIVVRRAEP
ncbi:methyltransferase domain-containing protein [Georgenia yuyongxinii]|uniref:Methyltransferase domain-containing protein n=1 Tax=Georgenia yuyongxinii TaxID=2589797 RepID=A0A5B8C439_9MICO|nr:methyltransferase domain-containing protein [Georgenia yuyongxinii]QDC25058.1 methyltransferase domain-containing protein [Georgenia yuyongxinii]